MRSVFIEDLNLIVNVNLHSLLTLGIISRHQKEATDEEITYYKQSLNAIKSMPKDLGKIIYLKYIQLAKVTPKRKLPTDKSGLTIRDYYSATVPKQRDLCRLLKMSTGRLSKLEFQAMEEMAIKLMEYKKEGKEVKELYHKFTYPLLVTPQEYIHHFADNYLKAFDYDRYEVITETEHHYDHINIHHLTFYRSIYIDTDDNRKEINNETDKRFSDRYRLTRING
ncbi:hypothetical protein [Eremococcus coleocola]|uniref:Uncharacterized protein n=1 Tax=Eremococcus coleocola ACS-139-V-Col8 TaxID=908337 RepID=E4KPZ7_9LACT|nr:hypothetical protein [Eremococcus coleocola]EFR31174.1 hypothetical protein HMPREF9257_1636 [Eremococcus coleocola ACS-139-V-Col8]